MKKPFFIEAGTSAGAVFAVVCEVFDIPPNRLMSMSRDAATCLARFAAIGLALEFTLKSKSAIARALGDRDHASGIYGARRYDELLASRDNEFTARVTIAREVLTLMARNQIEARVWNIDALAVARRVLANPARGPLAASALEVRAMALRLLELEEGDEPDTEDLETEEPPVEVRNADASNMEDAHHG